MWYSIPAQTQSETQPVCSSPVVLNVSRWRLVIPIAGSFERVLLVLLRVAEQEIGKVAARKRTVKSKPALGIGEVVLNLLVDGPACAELELMRAFGPGNIVANLVIVRRVVPRLPVDGVVRAVGSAQVDRGDTVVYVLADVSKDAIKGEVRGRLEYALWSNVNAVPVVIEAYLVEQVGVDDVGRVHHRVIAGVSEGIEGRGNV